MVLYTSSRKRVSRKTVKNPGRKIGVFLLVSWYNLISWGRHAERDYGPAKLGRW
ncbi:MAG: hypothetical protein AAB909_02660 [Patescibacteria group bacterium]